MKDGKFEPREWVLVRDNKDDKWCLAQFSNYDDDSSYGFTLCGGAGFIHCIPFKGNEKLLGTTDEYVEPYEPKEGDFVTYVYSDGDTFVMIYDKDDWYLASLKIKGWSPDIKPHYYLQFNKSYIERRPSTMVEKRMLLEALYEDKFKQILKRE